MPPIAAPPATWNAPPSAASSAPLKAFAYTPGAVIDAHAVVKQDVPLCTVGSGFPRVEEGRVLALYANEADLAPSEVGDGPYCSELTMLDAGTGARAGSRNPDARPGTRLIADDTFVLATGDDHLETETRFFATHSVQAHVDVRSQHLREYRCPLGR